MGDLAGTLCPKCDEGVLITSISNQVKCGYCEAVFDRYIKGQEHIWTVTGRSESGDDYGPYIYRNPPTTEQLTQLVKGLDYGNGDGPGYAGSYVHLEIAKTKFED